MQEFGRVDVLVNNAAYQMTHENIEDITDEEWDTDLRHQHLGMFQLVKAALPHMGRGRRSSTAAR